MENDILFQEAEKLGFDVRNSTGQSIIKEDSTSAAPVPEKTVLFNFFGGDDSKEQKSDEKENKKNNQIEQMDKKRKLVVVEEKPKEKDVDLVWDDIISLAKRFCRER